VRAQYAVCEGAACEMTVNGREVVYVVWMCCLRVCNNTCALGGHVMLGENAVCGANTVAVTL
jgi:hypothetical protein